MSYIEELLQELEEDDLEYLMSTVFDGDSVISKKKIKKLIKQEEEEYALADSIQFALKINLNSVYGVQIMPHFKFADEWQALGASTTLTGRILSKYGLIETIEQYFNPERESRFEFPLLDNILVASDDDSFFTNKETQKLRTAVISDTDSVTGDALVETNLYGAITLDELSKKGIHEHKNGKDFYFYNNLKVSNLVDGVVELDDVEFIYSHDLSKDLYEIELSDGSRIKVTEDHSIMVLDNGTLVEKKPFELNSNDVVVTY